MNEQVELTLQLVEATDAETLDRATQSLRRDLNEIDLVQARPTDTASVPGAKGDLNLLGTLSVTMVSAAIPHVIALISRWLSDRGRCVVRIDKPDGTSLEIQHSLKKDEIERIVASLVPK
ncbi:MAG TPA: hypothetical protein VIB78_07090 [Acidimicrobiia bacterium]